MDRGRQQHRPLLIAVAAGLLIGAGVLCAQGPASPVPSVGVPPPATATPDLARKHAAEKAAMEQRRQREQAAVGPEAQRRIEQLPAEERPLFTRNLRVWNELSPEDRDNLRRTENERKRAEIEKAYQQSGLHLDKDQYEVFALRYRQERRRLERELQEKQDAERARRLPGLVDGLKREFADKSAVSAVPSPGNQTSSPAPKPTPSVSVPPASPTASR